MNYSHTYHAGNFSDVFKHTILIALIKAMLRKDNAFCYLDTHAGPGHYDLFSLEAKKNKEHTLGIDKIFRQENSPHLIKEYLQCVQKINNRINKSIISSLRYYPGSPSIMHYFLRSQDRMILSELHPQEFRSLKNEFSNRMQVSTHLLDGYQGLKAFLPPKERRGLILIDPPYERPNELLHIATVLPIALKRFATGTFGIWYPIKDRPPIERFYRDLKENITRPMLVIELSIYPETSPLHLNGCGMLIINPPWQLAKHIQEFLPWLWKNLSIHGQGQFSITPLVS